MTFPCPNNCGAAAFPSQEILDIHLTTPGACSTLAAKTAQPDDDIPDSQPVQAPDTTAIDTECQGEFLFPKPQPGFRADESVIRKFDRLDKASAQTQQNVLLTGESGTGKTTLALHFAGITNRPLVKINMQMMVEASQLFGYREVNQVEGTSYVLGPFVHAIKKERCVVLLDDAAHVHDRTITNGLLPPLSDIRMVYLDYAGEYIPVAAGVIFILTGNQGHAYGGASKFDRALVSRCSSKIYMQHPPHDMVVDILCERTGIVPSDAARLSHLADNLREDTRSGIHVDMRGLLAAATDIKLGADFFEAVAYTLLGDLSPQEIENVRFAAHDTLSEQENVVAAKHGKRWIEWR